MKVLQKQRICQEIMQRYSSFTFSSYILHLEYMIFRCYIFLTGQKAIVTDVILHHVKKGSSHSEEEIDL